MKRAGVVVTLVLLAACSGGTTSATTTTAARTSTAPPATVAATSPATEPVTTPAPTTTTTPPRPTVPAGVQFDATPVTPTPASVPTDTIATIDPTTLPAPAQRAPTGFPVQTARFLGDASVVSTPTDKVAIAAKIFTPGQVGVVSTYQAIFWHSTDGISWQWIDLRPVLGDVASQFGVEVLNGGFIAFGEVLPPNDPLRGVATGVVLLSPDGVTWTETASLPRPFSVHPYRVQVVGPNLLLAGYEYICDNGVGDFAGSGAQPADSILAVCRRRQHLGGGADRIDRRDQGSSGTR